MPNNSWEKVLEARSKLEGWTFEDKSKYLYDLVLETKPEVVVEVGVWKGLSLASFCAASLDHPCKVFAVDPWSEAAMDENGYGKNLGERQWELDSIYNSFLRNFRHLELDANLRVMRETSWDGSFRFSNDSIDILHLDGAHTEWDSCRDVIAWTPRIKRGGYFIMDDANWETMKLVQELIQFKFDHLTYLENGKTRVYKKR
jgi:predicted O-methyltransferase YrrM